MSDRKILVNEALCHRCGYAVTSRHDNDFVTCKCGNLSVDGGTAYVRRVFKSDDWQELTRYEGDEPRTAQEAKL